MKNNEQEVPVEDQAARQHQPPVPAPDCPTGGGDGYGEVLAVSRGIYSSTINNCLPCLI